MVYIMNNFSICFPHYLCLVYRSRAYKITDWQIYRHVLAYLMVLPETLAMRDCEECDAHLTAVLIHSILHVYTHCTSTLIKYSKLWLVIKQACHLKK